VTNGQAIRRGMIPCEIDPNSGNFSRTGEVFHGSAVATVGRQRNNLTHVCGDCTKIYFRWASRVRIGIHWE
jgi:hypothetical protein